jgi:hypothetical protein
MTVAGVIDPHDTDPSRSQIEYFTILWNTLEGIMAV